MIREDLIEKIANIQNEEIEKAATKALEQMEKKKKRKKVIILATKKKKLVKKICNYQLVK